MVTETHGDRMGESAIESALHRIAAHTVRRQSNQHSCSAVDRMSCTHPHHRRDVHLMSTLLTMLGLAGEDRITGAEELEEVRQQFATAETKPAVDISELTDAGLTDR